jgi:tellurite resistance protein TerC
MSAFPAWSWVGFTALIVVLLLLDLLVLARGAREISFRQATGLSVFWIVLALLFGVVVFTLAGPERGGEYLAGYLIEKSLSVDNVFVFALIFSYFAVPTRHQYRVLFWGVVGALVLRGIFIALGAQLLERYDWMVYVFGAFLIYTGIRMAFHRDEEVHPERNPILLLVRRTLPMTADFQGERFFVRRGGSPTRRPCLRSSSW